MIATLDMLYIGDRSNNFQEETRLSAMVKGKSLHHLDGVELYPL